MTPGTNSAPTRSLVPLAPLEWEVYRARDPKLGRDVAIKVLPEAFARDAERMARFRREAKVLASRIILISRPFPGWKSLAAHAP